MANTKQLDKILAFVDLLGFSSMVAGNYEEAQKVLDDFYSISYEVIKNKRNKKVKYNLFSDSLLAYSEDYPAMINCITEIYRKCLKRNNDYKKGNTIFLLPRGAISVGYFNIEKKRSSPNFIVSPALVHSVKLEGLIKGSRLLIAVKSDDHQQVMDINWNNQIKSFLYDNSSFEFWEGYKYKDALWFLDLNKDWEEQKKEVIELIEIAIKLIKDNSDNGRVIDQHINTLRVGLLSYTKFLGQDDDVVLNEIMKEFAADQYWLIWLTIIEIIMNSKTELKYAGNSAVVDFYKKSSLKLGWIHVLEDINKPGQEYLKQSFKKFLDEVTGCSD